MVRGANVATSGRGGAGWIAYGAVENLFATRLSRARLALVFAFGLLHGMGFAEALSRLDLPRSEFAIALAGVVWIVQRLC